MIGWRGYSGEVEDPAAGGVIAVAHGRLAQDDRDEASRDGDSHFLLILLLLDLVVELIEGFLKVWAALPVRAANAVFQEVAHHVR